jgi:calcineurin-like phosphoesterase
MVGPYDSVIGRKKEQVIESFLTQVPHRYEVANENVKLCGIIVDVDFSTGKAKEIRRIQKGLQNGR